MVGLTIRCENPAVQRGYSLVNVDVLNQMAAKERDDWIHALRQLAARYQSPNEVSNAVKVIRIWIAKRLTDPTHYPLTPSTDRETLRLIKRLRRAVYEGMVSEHRRLCSANGTWRAFLKAAALAARRGALPYIDFESPSIAPFLHIQPDAARMRAANGHSFFENEVPANFSAEEDSFHSGLLVPISITLSDQQYLADYQKRLQQALDAFSSAAELEFRHLVRRRELGAAYKCRLPYAEVRAKFGHGSFEKYKDPVNKLHMFDPAGGHPHVHRFLISYVFWQQGGYPRPYIRYARNADNRPVKAIAEEPIAKFVARYGVRRLAPYFGLLNARTAVPLLMLLLIDHPRINVHSLLRAEIEDSHGHPVLILPAGDNDQATRLTVTKPRARSKKQSILTDRGRRVIQFVLDITEDVRKKLREQGRYAEARRLWVGTTDSAGYRLGSLSINSMSRWFHRGKSSQAIRESNLQKSTYASGLRCDHDFVRTHPRLSEWIGLVTLKTLRASAGVMVWFRHGGDIRAAAEAFGHKDIMTTICNYVPKPLQFAMYEREIRRWQNLLIIAATGSHPQALPLTDFDESAELDQFIRGVTEDTFGLHDKIGTLIGRLDLLASDVRDLAETQGALEHDECEALLIEDPMRLAIAFLYADSMSAEPVIRWDSDHEDSLRLWVELTRALLGPLPDSLRAVTQLGKRARAIADAFRCNPPRSPI